MAVSTFADTMQKIKKSEVVKMKHNNKNKVTHNTADDKQDMTKKKKEEKIRQ